MPRTVHVVVVSQVLLGWLQSIIVLVAMALVFRVRKSLLAGWQARRRSPGRAAGEGVALDG